MRQDQYCGEFFDSSGIPMCLCDAAGAIRERNGPFVNLFAAAAEVRGTDGPATLDEICDPGHRDMFTRVLAIAGEGHAGAPYPFQFWYVGKRGARRKADVNITRLPGKEVFLLTFQDVTDKVDAFDELNRRNRDLVGLVKITKLISSSLDPDKIAKVALDEAARLFDLDRGWLFSADEQTGNLSVAASLGDLPPPAAVDLLNNFLNEHVAERFKPAIIESGEGLRLSPREAELLDALGVRVVAMAPMIVGTAPRGVLCLGATGAGATVTPDRISLLLTLTHQMGVALENARLFRAAETSRQRYRQRTEEQTMLLNLARILSARSDFDSHPAEGAHAGPTITMSPHENLKQVMSGAAHLLRHHLGADGIAIYLMDPEASELRIIAESHSPEVGARIPGGPPDRLPLVPEFHRALEAGTPETWDDTLAAPADHPIRSVNELFGFRAVATLPLVYAGTALGLASITYDRPRPFSQDDRNLLAAVAAQLSISRMNAQHYEEVVRHRGDLERLSNQLFNAQEEERRRIARELHDEAGQSLYALKLGLEMMREKAPPHEKAVETLDEHIRVLSQTIENIRRITYDLRPTLLDDLGLVPAIRWFVDGFEKHTGIAVALGVEMPETKLDAAVEMSVYRILQEALTNVRRHATAKRVDIRVFVKDGGLRLEIQDDGAGFSAAQRAAASGGVGLIGMKERIASLGGSLAIDSLRGRGTNLSVEIPLAGSRRVAREAEGAQDQGAHRG